MKWHQAQTGKIMTHNVLKLVSTTGSGCDRQCLVVDEHIFYGRRPYAWWSMTVRMVVDDSPCGGR